ncbi:hypothetical protein RYX36_007882 [Vicia faba]
MLRPPIMIYDLNPEQNVWKIAIRVVDVWNVKECNGQQHLEAIIQDAKILHQLIYTDYVFKVTLIYTCICSGAEMDVTPWEAYANQFMKYAAKNGHVFLILTYTWCRQSSGFAILFSTNCNVVITA